MGRLADIVVWISRRLRLAALALLAIAALKTGAAAFDGDTPATGASAPISTSASVVSQ